MALIFTAAKKFFSNPSLLVILIFEFILLFLVEVLFALLALSSESAVIAAAVVSTFLTLLVNGFFKAGLAGMARNVVQDGSTSLKEFFPSARRYWGRFVGLIFVLGAIVLVLQSPLYFLQAQASSWQQTILVSISVLGTAFVAFFFLWAAPMIAFEDATLLSAIRRSVETAVRKTRYTLATLLVCIATFLVYWGVWSAINLPFILSLGQPTPGTITLGGVLEVATALVFAVFFGAIVLYVFMRYSKIQKTPL